MSLIRSIYTFKKANKCQSIDLSHRQFKICKSWSIRKILRCSLIFGTKTKMTRVISSQLRRCPEQTHSDLINHGVRVALRLIFKATLLLIHKSKTMTHPTPISPKNFSETWSASLVMMIRMCGPCWFKNQKLPRTTPSSFQVKMFTLLIHKRMLLWEARNSLFIL